MAGGGFSIFGGPEDLHRHQRLHEHLRLQPEQQSAVRGRRGAVAVGLSERNPRPARSAGRGPEPDGRLESDDRSGETREGGSQGLDRASVGWPPPAVVWTVASIAALAGSIGGVGGDALWLVALGARIVRGQLPTSIPYATAATGGWHDVPAGAELVLWSLYHALGGVRGLAVAEAAAAALGFGFLAQGLRAQASSGATLLVSGIVLAGSLPWVAVANASLFSLALLPALLALLESESRAPSRRLWLSVPLLAVWGNLHGEALAGFALLACYLVFERARFAPGQALCVLGAGAVALLANPALWHTPDYYRGVFGSEAARQGAGLWAPLGTGGFDLVLIAAAALLAGVILAGGRHLRLWEGVALLGLAGETVEVARTGTWLLFVAAFPAVRSLRLGNLHRLVFLVAAAAFASAACGVLAKGPPDPGSAALAARAAATGEPVLADAVLGQQVALAGGRVWVDNPIDAFRPGDQLLYLEWLDGRPSGESALTHAAYVLVERGSQAARRAASDGRLVLVAATRTAVLYRVRRR